jgi:amylosucrase
MNQAAIHRLLASDFLKDPKTANPDIFYAQRLAANLSLIQQLFFSLYPENENRGAFDNLLDLLPSLFKKRPQALKRLDLERVKAGNWYQSEELVGMQLYADLFNKNLKGVTKKIPYFESLGVNFLHIMPLTTRPERENDGGYAVNSYTEIDPRFGSREDLLELTAELRQRKMFLMLDFVINHTSDEFPWARKAALGDPKYQRYYYTYPDRIIPNEFEKSLPEIFPQTAPGNFTWCEPMGRWVMTVFNRYQWDLNYTNPEVFLEMLINLSDKVNMGVDVIRLDALAFLWKKIGTNSQNLPEAHRLIALFRVCLQVVAPGVLLLAEAIVAPRDILPYFGQGALEGNMCEIAYNASLMALLWNSVATKKTDLLVRSMKGLPSKPRDATWINYIRCHDDIGLGYDDTLIRDMGWDPAMHRKFLVEYYCGGLEWSPATGRVFMYNPRTGDGRITGSAASLLGLEKALTAKEPGAITEAVDKIMLMYGIILSIGGIPLIYAGDEIGTLNDYSYLQEKSKQGDSRWINRPKIDWETIASLDQGDSVASKIFSRLQKLIACRKSLPEFADRNNLVFHNPNNSHILVFERPGEPGNGVLVLANFDAHEQVVDGSWVARLGYTDGNSFRDLAGGRAVRLTSGLLPLKPYQLLWIQKV